MTSTQEDHTAFPPSPDAGGEAGPRWTLRLYVAGMTPRSLTAIRNLKDFCRRRLAGRVDLRVVDVYQQRGLAREARIVAAPTLIKVAPEPVRRFIGDLSRTDALAHALGLEPEGSP